MSDLISKSEEREWVENWFVMNSHYHPYAKKNTIPIGELYDILERMPTIDAVPVVRCKKCKWWLERHPRLGVPWCRQMHIDKSEDGYCDAGNGREE